MKIDIQVPIEPVGQLRPRATHHGAGIRMYDPPKVAEFKRDVAEYVADLMEKDEIPQFKNEALAVRISVYRKVQNSISSAERLRRLSDVHRPTVKYDLDNYIKSILDALNGVLWDDDKNIVSIHAEKYYTTSPFFKIEVDSI